MQDEVKAVCVEVDRLPERYRIPVLLCFFEGLTHAEASRRTGWAIGTLAGRLARAKELLGRRLSRKGLGVGSFVLALPAGSFIGETAQAAVAFAARRAVGPIIKPAVSQLAEGVLKTMNTIYQQLAAALVVGCLTIGAGWSLSAGAAPQSAATSEPPAQATATSSARAPSAAQPEQPQERLASRAEQAVTVNSLKQVMLAMHNYTEVNSQFPHDILDKNGKPLLSWRVAILPYLEYGQLYKEFKLDEAWDSENNKKALAKMPATYRLGFQKKGDSKTFFQVFAGAGTPFEQGKKLTFSNVTDGTSNTFGAVIAGPAVEWTKPADLPFDRAKEAPKLDLPYKNIFCASMMDGSVRTLSPTLDPATLKILIGMDDGQVLPDLTKMDAKLPLTKKEIEAIQGYLKEDQRLLGLMIEQLKERQLTLEALAKNPNLDELKIEDNFNLNEFADPTRLADVVERLKTSNEELKKVLERKQKK
jgi:hypothetical protein